MSQTLDLEISRYIFPISKTSLHLYSKALDSKSDKRKDDSVGQMRLKLNIWTEASQIRDNSREIKKFRFPKFSSPKFFAIDDLKPQFDNINYYYIFTPVGR